MVSSDSSLSFLNEAILKASPIPDSLTTLLATGGPFAFLAPVNDAFRILGFNTPSDLDTLNPDSLRNMILLSMVPQRLFSYDITDSSTYMSANDSTLLFANSGVQTSVRVLGSTFSSNIIAANLMAINGVLFKIDSVLDH
jgi:uncharacterized surface protein with fasciclin (FAS1) repeats